MYQHSSAKVEQMHRLVRFSLESEKYKNMRKALLTATFLLLAMPVALMAQKVQLAGGSKCDAVSQVRLLQEQKTKSPEESIRLIAKVTSRYDAKKMEAQGIVTGAKAGDIVTLRLPLSKLSLVDGCAEVLQYSVSHPVFPTLNRTRFDTRTDSVHQGLGLPRAFTGEGVIVGITDWGFDYKHPNYNNNGESNRRLLQAWDQFKLSGPAPDGFDYGTVFSNRHDLLQAKGDTAGLYNYATHGTHVAGIAAGRGVEGEYMGQAPDANLLFASFYLDLASWMDAVQWMKNVSEQEGKRLVVNNSWGMYTLGPIDGTSLASQAINNWSDSGIVFVVSGGNCGNDNMHVSKTFGVQADTLRSRAAYYGYNENGQNIVLWGEPGGSFEFSFAMVSGEDSLCLRWVNTADGSFYLDSAFAGRDGELGFRITVEQANIYNSRPHILLNVDKNANYHIDIAVTASEGTVHAWNLASLDNGAGNMGGEFTRGNSLNYTKGDNAYGIGEPACADKCIAVAAHNADGLTYEGMLASFSSRGPVIDGRRKPEVSAPGVEVVSSISSYSDQNYTAVMTYSYASRKYIWAKMSGTSMSGPAVTGIVALMLQADPTLTAAQVKQYLCSSARNDGQTGPLHERDSMSDAWGWGKANALAAVNEVLAHVDINQADGVWFEKSLQIYPNPASDRVTVYTGCQTPQTVIVYTISGMAVISQQVTMEGVLDISALPHGIYVVKCGARTARLIH